MKTKSILIIFGISLIVNLISIYNIGLAYISFFFFVQFFVPRIFVKLISLAEKHEKEKSKPFTRFVVAYGNHEIIRLLHRISIIVSLIVLVAGTLFIAAIQLFLKNKITYFLHDSVQIGKIDYYLQIISYFGYGIYAFAIVFVIIDGIKILKQERLF